MDAELCKQGLGSFCSRVETSTEEPGDPEATCKCCRVTSQRVRMESSSPLFVLLALSPWTAWAASA